MSERSGPQVPAELRRSIQSEAWARALDVEYLDLGPGSCTVALTLQPHMVNHQGYAHGGVIFSLADIAFGAACNAHGETAVALTVTITFLAPATPGVRLVAEGRERYQGRRTGFYDIVVRTGEGVEVARLQCVAHRIPERGSVDREGDG